MKAVSVVLFCSYTTALSTLAHAATPALSIAVNGAQTNQVVDLGSTLEITGDASTPAGDLNDHWLEVKNPQGSWSWEGWMKGEPWEGSLNGSARSSQKTGYFKPASTGTYAIRTTASAASSGGYAISREIRVEVRAAATTTSTTTTPTVLPVSSSDEAAILVNGSTTNQTVDLGSSVEITGAASARGGDLVEHWLEVRNPQGTWSWEGWLSGEPWGGALSGTGRSSQKTGYFRPTSLGTYTVRCTAAARSVAGWMISREIRIEVKAAAANSSSVSTLVRSNGTIDAALYQTYLNQRDAVTFSQRLGPTFAQLNPGAIDDRPTHNGPQSRRAGAQWWGRIEPFELGPQNGPLDDNDYWSESGQTLIVPDDPTHSGVSRMQVFAYYNHSFAISPRYDISGGDRDFFGDYYGYRDALGKAPTGAVASVRNYSMLQNEALIVTKDGLLGAGLTQTSRADGDWPMPVLVLPQTKKPTALAVTSSNELALISVWDVNTQKGQLAIVALEGACLPFHTMRRTAQPNQGSWSNFKLLGYVDLPFATPSSIAAASNSTWIGPSQTNSMTLGQVAEWLEFSNVRDGMRETAESQWTSVFASKGYAIVASKLENKVCLVDLSPYLNYVRESYLAHDDATYRSVCAQEDAGTFPASFADRPDLKPKVVWEKAVPSPNAVLASHTIDYWSTDYFKAYVASEDGNIHVINTSSLMARYHWQKISPIAQTGSFYVGKNPTSMCFARHREWRTMPLMPYHASGQQETADPLSNTFYVACRGERKVVAVCSYREKGAVYREIKDKRLGDPVAVSVAYRGNIVTVADYNGKGLHSFRVGPLSDNGSYGYSATYQVNNPGFDFDYAGFMPLAGFPFMLNSANVN
jgi:hypothetical protein